MIRPDNSLPERLTHVDLFSGIGGFALAARWAGIETVQFVELDPFCQKVLQKNFPGVPIHDDIKTFTNTRCEYGERAEVNGKSDRPIPCAKNASLSERSTCNDGEGTFLLTGGFPCQPFSCAGKRRGKEDDRYLWEEMLRVIKEFKPTWIIGENVNGIRSMEFQDGLSEMEGDTVVQEDGNGDYTNVLDGICDSLEAIGYEVQPIIVPACAVNAPHRRDRVWIVAHSLMCEHGTGRGQIGETDGLQGINRASLCSRGIIGTDSHAPDTQSQQTQPTKQRGLHAKPCGKDRWDEPWIEAATRLCRVDDGVPRVVDRVARLKALGNAIVPQIAFVLMQTIRGLR